MTLLEYATAHQEFFVLAAFAFLIGAVLTVTFRSERTRRADPPSIWYPIGSFIVGLLFLLIGLVGFWLH